MNPDRLPEPDAICRLTVRELTHAYARGDLSPVEALDAVLARADAVNPRVSAFYWRCDEQARASAAASRERWARGAPRGGLDGIPFSAKDNLDVAGAPTYLGSATRLGAATATETHALVRACAAQGAVLFAKSTMVETGLFSASFSGLYGPVRNPWNLAKSTNGSSSGGAAATAAHLGPLHLGTDGGGSLRSPAASCGCVALKPTAHTAPFGAPPGELPASAAVSGFLTRDVADQALVFQCLASVTPLPPPPPLSQLRLAYFPAPSDDPGVGAVHPVVGGVVQRALDRLGADVALDELSAPLFEGPLWEAAVVSAFTAVVVDLAALAPELAARAHPIVRDTAARVAASARGATLERLRELLADGGGRMAAAFEHYDLLLLACNYYPSFDAERPWHDDCALIESAGYGWTSGACPHVGWAGGGPPSVSIPCGLDANGVPVGLLIVGRPGADLALLHAAAELEQRIEF